MVSRTGIEPAGGGAAQFEGLLLPGREVFSENWLPSLEATTAFTAGKCLRNEPRAFSS
jgi:hypothetical protein